MNLRYRVELNEAERTELQGMLKGGRHAARTLKRAQILLAADRGVADESIAESLGVSGSTVTRTKRRFVEGNLERALSEEPRPGAARKLTDKEQTHRQRGSAAGGCRLREPAGRPRPLDARTSGRRDGAAHRA
jgi:hypothetical protein